MPVENHSACEEENDCVNHSTEKANIRKGKEIGARDDSENKIKNDPDSLVKATSELDSVKTDPENDWKKFTVLCIVTFLYYLPMVMVTYIRNEWIQNSIKESYFPNTEFSNNVSSCKSNHSSEEYKMYTKVQQESAHWIMYISIGVHATSFFANLILPCYTDTYGRKFLIILTLSGFLLEVGVTTTVIYTKQSFVYVVVVNAVEGLTGAALGFLSVTFSYIADVIKEAKKRVLSVVILEAVLLFTIMISGLVSGLFVDNCGYFVAALTCTGIQVFTLGFAIFMIKESLKPALRRKPISVCAALKRPLEFYTSSTFRGKTLQYTLLVLAFAFATMSSLKRGSMETLYLLGMPFCWTPTWVGYFSFARHAIQAIIGLGSIKLLEKFISYEMMAIVSVVSCFVSYIVEALATSEVLMFMVAVIAVFSFSMVPIVRGIMSTMTPPDKQGSMFASLSSVEVLASVTASVSENNIYSATVSFMNGFVFLSMACFNLVDFVLLVWFTVISRKDRNSSKYEQFSSEDHSGDQPEQYTEKEMDVSATWISYIDVDGDSILS